MVNYEYVYCPGGIKVYGTGGMFAMGQSKAMFMEQVEMWLLGGNDVYFGMGVTNDEGKDNTVGYNKNI